MRFIEILKVIFNKIIYYPPKEQPESKQKEVELIGKMEEVEKKVKKAVSEKERLIWKYQKYAYHHKKYRIRKKYHKKLIEVLDNEG